MEGIYSLTILSIIFVSGELIAKKTKALLSTTFVIAILMMVGFWVGLNKNILTDSGLGSIGMILVGILITSMGTMINFKQLKLQVKTVVVSLFGMSMGVLIIIFIGQFFISREMAIASSPIFAGGNAAMLMMSDILKGRGLDSTVTFCVLVLITQQFIGTPIASILLRKEAKLFIKDRALVTKYATMSEAEESSNENKKSNLKEMPSYIFMKLALVASVSLYLSSLTGGVVHYFVFALLLGIALANFKVLEPNVLMKTNSSYFLIFATTMIIFGNMATTTPSMVLSMLVPLLFTLGLGALGVIIGGLVISRVVKMSPYLAISLGLCCTFGFPTTMFIPNEIAIATTDDKVEQKALINYLLPSMLTAGFVTVTIASVFLAGILANML